MNLLKRLTTIFFKKKMKKFKFYSITLHGKSK